MMRQPFDERAILFQGSEAFPELGDDAALVQALAIRPMDPALARSYARRKYLIYFFIAGFGLGLPLCVFGITALAEHGLSHRFAQLLIGLTLVGFFIFFFAMIRLIVSRGNIHPHLGIAPAEIPANNVAVVAVRHGRTLEYGFRDAENFWRCSKPSPPFAVAYREGAFHAAGELPPGAERVFANIPPHRRWRRLTVMGGPQGIQTRRPVRLAKYYLHDLWLLEKILAAFD